MRSQSYRHNKKVGTLIMVGAKDEEGARVVADPKHMSSVLSAYCVRVLASVFVRNLSMFHPIEQPMIRDSIAPIYQSHLGSCPRLPVVGPCRLQKRRREARKSTRK